MLCYLLIRLIAAGYEVFVILQAIKKALGW